MENETIENKTGIPLSSKVAVGIFLALIAVFFVVVRARMSLKSTQTEPHGQSEQDVQVTQDVPTLILKAAADRLVYTEGETIPLVIFGDSKGTPITGFDAALRFAQDTVSYVSATSLHADFDVYPTQRDNTIFITGVKKLSKTEETVFGDVPLVEVAMKAQTKGTADIDFIYAKGATNDSNLIDENTKDVLGQVEGVRVFVGSSIIVKKDRTVTFGDGTIRLLETVVPEEQCRDCTESAKFEVKFGSDTRTLEFKAGGIVGLDETSAEAFGYRFEQEEILQDQLTMRVVQL